MNTRSSTGHIITDHSLEVMSAYLVALFAAICCLFRTCVSSPTLAPTFSYSFAPDILYVSATATRNSVIAEVFLSGEGTAFCAVYSGGIIPMSTTAIIMEQHFATMKSNEESVSVELTGLQPSTFYDIYCASRSNSGEISGYVGTLDSKVTIVTDCCRQVEVSLLGTSFNEEVDVNNMFAFSVDGAPSGGIIVTLVVKRVDTQSGLETTVSGMLFPDSLTFTDKTADTAQYMSLVGSSAGTYKVSAVLTGSDQNSYEVVFRGSVTTFVLHPSNVEPPTPKATSVVFSADGSTMTLLFDSNTDEAGRKGVFKCNLLLTFEGSESSTCQWTSASALLIRLGGSSRVGVGGAVAVKDNTLRAYCKLSTAVCATWNTLTSAANTLAVVPPTVPISPKVAVSAPSRAGPCDSPRIDVSASTGSGGRAWASVSITVESLASVTALQTFFDTQYTVSPPTPIPRATLTSGYVYNFQIRLCNFLGGCTTNTHQLTVMEDRVPVVSILGQQVRTITRASTLLLQGHGFMAECDGSSTFRNLTYRWTVYQNGVVSPSLVSVTADPTKFRLPPYSLIAGNLYEVSITATNSISKLSATAKVQVLVSRMDIVASIAGGVGQSIRQGDSLLLDASGSYDDDKVDRSNKQGLSFAWTCHQQQPKLSLVCGLGMTVSGSKVTLSAAVDPLPSIGAVYAVSVTVSDSTRQSKSTVMVTVGAPDAPRITLTNQNAAVKINPSNKVVLQGTVQQTVPGLAVWSLDDSSVSLASSLQTPTSHSLPAGSHTVYLVLSPDSLVGKATPYLFSLSVGTVSASVSVTVNTAPSPGIFAITPNNGTAMSTKFVFSADKWTDVDVPVTYEFGYVTKKGSVSVVRGRAENTFASTSLAAGDSSAGNILVCQLRVFDALNAYVSVHGDVVVRPLVVSVTDLQNTISSQLLEGAGDLNSRKETISVASSMLNDQDCSTAPSCAALFRAKCLSTANTCGACLMGYLGTEGDDNSPCMTEANVPDLNEEITCNDDSQCTSWQYCTAGQCTHREKQCKNDCSGRGKCVMVLKDSGVEVDTCYLKDNSCGAVCSCEEGYSGTMCQMDDSEYSAKKLMREELLNNLLLISEMDDPTEDSVVSWQSALLALTSTSDELSLDGSEVALGIAARVLNSGSSIGISYETLRDILLAIDSAATASSSSTGQHRVRRRLAELTTTIDLLDSYASVTASSMVQGQAAESSIGSSFRMTTEVVSAGAVVSVPRSYTETWLGTEPSSCTLDSISSGKVSVMSIMAKLYAADLGLTSNAMRIRVVDSEDDSTVPTITVKLQNTVAQSYDTIPGTTSVSTICKIGGDLLHHHHCPGPLGGFTLTHECNGTDWYILQSPCPNATVAPSCKLLGNIDIFNCSVVVYTHTSTTCRCEVKPDGSGRRRTLRSLGALDDSGALEMAVVSELVVHDFATTIATADDFNSLSDVKKTLTVLLMYVFLWAGGLLGVLVCTMRQTQKTLNADIIAADLQHKKDIAATTRSKEAIRNYLTTYVNEIFPAVFRPTASAVRFWNEISKHHRYLLLFTATGKNADMTRILTCIHLLTIQSMLMFILAVCYDLEFPKDDGSCASYSTRKACLRESSPFDTSKSVCEWSSEDGREYCSYVDAGISIQAIIIISIVVALFTAPINLIVDFIFIEILSAPTADSLKVQASRDAASRRVFRRLSNMTQRVSAVSVAAVNRVRKGMGSSLRRGSSGRKFDVDMTRLVPDSAQEAQLLATQSAGSMLEDAKRNIKIREESRKSQRKQSRLSLVIAKQERKSSYLSTAAEEGDEKTPPRQPSDVTLPQHADGAPDMDEDLSVVTLRQDRKLRQKFAELYVDIGEQRKLLKPSQQEAFDAMWGMDPTGEFSLQRQSTYWLDMNKSAEELIQAEMQFVKQEVQAKYEKLRFATDVQTGVELLHLFVLDLLGRDTPVAKIFLTKSEEDFRHTMVVSYWMKVAAWVAVVIINLFFVYFSMLRGLERGQRWQNLFLMACIVQFIIEVFFYETSECAIVHYYIPNLAKKEVQSVSFTLHQAVQKICTNTVIDNADVVLDAPRYLFVSTNLAQRFPDLLESVIVQSYHTYSPGELARKWKISHGSTFTLNMNPWARSNARVRRFTLTALFIAMMQQLGSTNPIIQRVLIHLLQPLAVSAICLLLVVFKDHPWYAIILVPFVSYCFYSFYGDFKRDRLENKMSKTTDIHPDLASDGAVSKDPLQHMSSENYMDINLPRPGSSSRGSSSSQLFSSGDGSRKSSDKSIACDDDTVTELQSVRPTVSAAVAPKPAGGDMSLVECKDVDVDSSSSDAELARRGYGGRDVHKASGTTKFKASAAESKGERRKGSPARCTQEEVDNKDVPSSAKEYPSMEVDSDVSGGLMLQSVTETDSGVDVRRGGRPLVLISESDSDTTGMEFLPSVLETDSSVDGPARSRPVVLLNALTESEDDSNEVRPVRKV